MKIEGKNAVLEALRSELNIDSLLVLKGESSAITKLAKENGVKFSFVDKEVLDKNSATGKHQGYIAVASEFSYSDIDDFLQNDFLVILDSISDPHNFGSILRVCECAGVDGVVIAKNRQVKVNETVLRTSAGAATHIKVAEVVNIANTIEHLQKNGFWVYCADMDGELMYNTDLTGKIALVVGGEDSGVTRLVKSKCDGVLKIPMQGKVNSLNASVACGLVVYEAVRQRNK